MSTPAGNPGGDTTAPIAAALADLPARIRVHALAKLLGRSSREVLAAVTELGADGRSVQSSIDRELALRVAEALGVTAEEPAAEPEQAPEQPAAPQAPGSVAPQAPGSVAPQAPGFPTPGFSEPVSRPVESPTRVTPPTPVFASASPLFLPPEPVAAPPRPAKPVAEPEPVAVEDETEEAEEAFVEEVDEGRPRRRRGRRGRGRGKGGQDEQTEETTSEGEAKSDRTDNADKSSKKAKAEPAEAEPSETAEEEPSEGEDSASRRRRRRRRRRGGDAEEANGSPTEDDPPNTVVHVREAREDKEKPESDGRDEVRSVRGSTRLEAKRQRRRDGREAGRRRAPILSEAEFLARREAVDRAMVVRERGDRIQIGVLEDGVLVEHFVTSSGSGSLVGNVYLGRVQNVLPSMEAAFVDIGRGRNAVLYAGEVDWDAAGLEGKARKIEQALSTGDSVLVQVTKDPVGHKGARLTTQISLPGRFLVYVPGGGATGISRKLPENERRRLKDVLKRVVPEDAGVIIRTASEGISEEELARDVRRLQAQWQVIKDKTEGTNGVRKVNAPSLVYEEPDLLVKVVRDLFTEDFSALVVQGDTAWETVEAYVSHVAPELADRLRKHVGTNDVFAEYRIDEQLLKALDRKVWLPSGGYLVIDRTEAMTVIDVNTGKFTGSGGNLEETVTRNNLESAEEIVRQLRLRDIGGIIVIDFIDMVLESNRDLVLRRLTECLGRDRTRHQVAEVTSLGLVQMTRKRVGTGLLEAFGTTCEHCKGRGVLVSTEPVTKPNGNGNGDPNRGTRRSRGRADEAKDKPVNKDAAKEAAAQAAKDAVRGIAKATITESTDQPPASETPEPTKSEESPRGERHRHRTRTRHRSESRNGRTADDHEHTNGSTYTPDRTSEEPTASTQAEPASTPAAAVSDASAPVASTPGASTPAVSTSVGSASTGQPETADQPEQTSSANGEPTSPAGQPTSDEPVPSATSSETAPSGEPTAEPTPGEPASVNPPAAEPSTATGEPSTETGEPPAGTSERPAGTGESTAPESPSTPSTSGFSSTPPWSSSPSAVNEPPEATPSTPSTTPTSSATSATELAPSTTSATEAATSTTSTTEATPSTTSTAEPATSATSAAEPATSATSTAEASEEPSVPAPTTPPRRQPRRAASRPAGPPVSARRDG